MRWAHASMQSIGVPDAGHAKNTWWVWNSQRFVAMTVTHQGIRNGDPKLQAPAHRRVLAFRHDVANVHGRVKVCLGRGLEGKAVSGGLQRVTLRRARGRGAPGVLAPAGAIAAAILAVTAVAVCEVGRVAIHGLAQKGGNEVELRLNAGRMWRRAVVLDDGLGSCPIG